MKAYRDAAGYRKIPIGYSHADVAGLRPVLQNYLACGDPAQAIDFFGLNAYEWCGESSFANSGYAYLLNQTLDYPGESAFLQCFICQRTNFPVY